MRRDERIERLILILGPILGVWFLLLFSPADFSTQERIAIGLLFPLVYGPLMYLRIKN